MMGSVVDDRTFKPNFTPDGVLRLREKVNEKLKEFMGDYTDDSLVVRRFVFISYSMIKRRKSLSMKHYI